MLLQVRKLLLVLTFSRMWLWHRKDVTAAADGVAAPGWPRNEGGRSMVRGCQTQVFSKERWARPFLSIIASHIFHQKAGNFCPLWWYGRNQDA